MHDHPSGRNGSPRTRRRADITDAIVCQREEYRGDVGLVVIGEVDMANADLFRRELLKLVHAAHSEAWLDLAQLSFIDASGVRALLAAQQSAHWSGIELVLRSPSLPVRRILAMTATASALTIVDN